MSRVVFYPFDAEKQDDKRLLRHCARRALELRRLRSQVFGTAISKEAAWEMLLALYAFGRSLSVVELTSQTEVPGETARRWIEFLVDEELVKRSNSPRDARLVMVAISERGEELMEKYLTAALEVRP